MYIMRSISLLLVSGIIFISGCNDQNKNLDNRADIVNEEESVNYWDSDNENTLLNEKMLEMSQKLRALNSDKTMDKVVITVNGIAISKREIEAAKVFAEYSGPDALTVKERIEKTIKDRVLDSEAERIGITVSQKEIDEQIDSYKEYYKNGFPKDIEAVIEGMGMTEDEYYSFLSGSILKKIKRNRLWIKFRDENEAKIQEEAEKRDLSAGEIENEYKDKFETELVEKADIIILDDEVKKLLE